MAKDEAYYKAEQKILAALETDDTKLSLNFYRLTEIPDAIGQLTNLEMLNLNVNQLSEIPDSLGRLTNLQQLHLSGNQLSKIPDSIGQLTNLEQLYLSGNQLSKISVSIGKLSNLQRLYLDNNQLSEIPDVIGQLSNLQGLYLDDNPLNPLLAATYAEGLDAVKAYLRAEAEGEITLKEAKLILVGEGDVGKTCLMDALQDKPFEEHDTTHGIQISHFQPKGIDNITINGWDFGGQTIYRPTHQLFFTAPAIYLIVWKAREGISQGFVEEWMELVQRREPSAKMIIVATHARDRQADIDISDLKTRFGNNLIGQFAVDNKPDENSVRFGIEALKQEIAQVAANLPEMGRRVPKRWQDTQDAFEATNKPYIKLEKAFDICLENGMGNRNAAIFMDVSRRLGRITYYPHDNVLKNIVILKPDWLAQAISLVLDDAETRQRGGLVSISRLSQLWNNPERDQELRYPEHLHPIFVRLMERFDLSYKVTDAPNQDPDDPTNLIAQLVEQQIPKQKLHAAWHDYCTEQSYSITQTQVCRFLEQDSDRIGKAEGLLFQLIVRFHKYSLGKDDYSKSVHWKRGLVLEHPQHGRAFLQEKEDGISMSVHALYPLAFMNIITDDIDHLIKQYWQGLRYEASVSCSNIPNEQRNSKCQGNQLFDVEDLLGQKEIGNDKAYCKTCRTGISIDTLLNSTSSAILQEDIRKVQQELAKSNAILSKQGEQIKLLRSYMEDQFRKAMNALADEAKNGPRLFSIVPIQAKAFNPKKLTTDYYRLTLYCEHSRLPLYMIDREHDNGRGVYEIELTKEWFIKATKYISTVAQVLSIASPVVGSGIQLALKDSDFKMIEQEFKLTMSTTQNVLAVGKTAEDGLMSSDLPNSIDENDPDPLRAEGAALRELHGILQKEDTSANYGGLVRVMDNQGKFLWVHPQFEGEY